MKMKKTNNQLTIIVFIAVISVLSGASFFGKLDAIILLTGITVLILYYYTKETFLLRKETQKQTSNLFTPYLSLEKDEDGEFYITNLGKGIAKNISFEPEIQINNGFMLNIPLIGPKDKKYLSQKEKDEEGTWGVSPWQLPDSIDIVYWDTLENKYQVGFLRDQEYQTGFIESYQGMTESA